MSAISRISTSSAERPNSWARALSRVEQARAGRGVGARFGLGEESGVGVVGSRGIEGASGVEKPVDGLVAEVEAAEGVVGVGVGELTGVDGAPYPLFEEDGAVEEVAQARVRCPCLRVCRAPHSVRSSATWAAIPVRRAPYTGRLAPPGIGCVGAGGAGASREESEKPRRTPSSPTCGPAG